MSDEKKARKTYNKNLHLDDDVNKAINLLAQIHTNGNSNKLTVRLVEEGLKCQPYADSLEKLRAAGLV